MSIRRLLILIGIVAFSSQLTAVSESLAKETDTEVPLPGINTSLQPDLFTGTLTGSIPIEVPPGRNGMQPHLALSYASSGGNGWVGMGWKLEMGTIERQTKWGVIYNPSAQEELDGKVYTMRLNGVSVDLVPAPAPAPSGEYRAKIEGSFLRVKNNGATGWEVTDPKGTKYMFGTTAGTRVQSADGTKIFKWCLEKIEDRDGNYLTISYTPDQGQLYLSQIDYTGNTVTGALPTKRVKFYLESRTDAPDMYTSYFSVKTAKRLKTIAVYSDLAMTQPVRAYGFTYIASGNTTASLLLSIQQFGRDVGIDVNGVLTGGTAMPPITLGWQQNAPGTLASQGSVTPYVAWHSATPLDFNGDGKTDFLINTTNAGWFVYQSNGNGTFTHVSTPSPYSAWHSPMPGDFNGDGCTDFMINTATAGAGWYVYQSNCNGTFTFKSSPTPYEAWHSATPLDFNGDGLTDFLINTTNAGWFAYQSNGNGTFTHVSTPSPYSAWHSPTPMDFNGDGRMDFVINTTNAGWFLYQSNGNGTFTHVSTPSPYSAWHSPTPLDFNWDGRMDIMFNTTNAGWQVYRSNGDGTFTYVSTPSQFSAWTGPRAGDFNGDGRMDLMFNTTNAGWFVYRSNGDGTFTHVSTPTQYSAWYSPVVGDFNGDGKDEFLINTATAGAGWYVFLANAINGGVPDLLTSLTNGLGGATTVQYVPSTQPQFQNAPGALPYPVQTVNTVTTCDNWNGTSCTGMASTTVYTYQQGFHHIGQREFRGFLYTNEMGPAGPNGERQITATWFHQSNGTLPQNDDPKQTQGHMMGKPIRTVVTDGSNRFLSDTLTTYAADANGAAPWFNPPQQVDLSICNGTVVSACGTGKQTRVVSTYDHATGALTREDHHGDLTALSDDQTIVRTYSPNTTDWLVSFPTSEIVYQGIGTTTRVAQTDFYYDGTTSCAVASTNQVPTKGHLTRTVRAFFNGTSTHTAPETRMAYDNYGNVTCTRDANGNTSTVTYDSATNTFPISAAGPSPSSLTTSTSYYGLNGVAIPATGFYGQVQNVTDPNGRVTSHEYDALGRRTKTTNPDGFFATTTYNYGAGQTVGTQHVLVTNSLGHSSANYFDGLGRGIRTTSTYTAGPTREAKTDYNVRGQVLRTSLPYFTGGTVYWQTMQYDALGRMTQVTNPDGTTSKSCYSDWTTVTVERDGERKRETRDALGRVVTIQEYNATVATCDTTLGTPYATTNYVYDVLGNLLSVTDAKGNVSTMAYDSLNRKKSMHDPDMGDWSYLYDANGNLTKQTDAKGQALWFTYDSLNRRVQKDLGGTAPKTLGTGDVRYTYDDTVTTTNRKGRLKQVVDAATNVTIEYDVMGRISKSTKVLDGTTYVTTNAYDGLGRLSSVTYPSTPAKSVDYVYEGPFLKQVKDKPTDGTVTYVQYAGWNEMGQPGTATYNVGTNQVTTTYTYQTASNATCGSQQTFRPCTTKVQKGTNPAYLDLRYAFTTGGNVNDIYDQLTPTNDQHFLYDALDRLTSANGPYGTSGANSTFAYSYDQIGNMTANPQVGTYTYPTSGATSVRPHAASVAGPYPITYDNNGNVATMTDPTGFFGYNASYNVDNRLSSVTTTYNFIPTTSTFVYDGDGGRVKKIVGATTTRYINKFYECDTTGVSTSCSRFIWAGSQRVATVASNGTTHFWHQDHLGSSTIITDSTGAKAQTLSYFPYGDLRVTQSFTTPAVDVPYKYTGKELDTASNLYFYESRYYHPVFGRFVAPDTIVPDYHDPQSLNRYSYAGNNPLLYTDPTGHRKCFLGICLSPKETNMFKTGLGIGLQVFGGPMGWAGGSYLLSQSKTGRYILSAEILVASVAIAAFCEPCGAAGIGAAIGSWSTAAVGAYSAHVNGGDLSTGLLFGASVGAVTGGTLGQLSKGIAFATLPFWDKVAVAGGVGFFYGGASGAAEGFAGGKGTVADIFRSAGIGAGFGAVTAAGLQAVAPPLSELASSMLDRVGFNGVTVKDIRPIFEGELWPGGPIGPRPWAKPLYSLATNVGQFLDVNRLIILGGGAALGTGAAFNYQQVLPLIGEKLSEKCGVENPCSKGGTF